MRGLAWVVDRGAVAQLGERLPCTQEVGGSIPPGSTKKLTSLWVCSVQKQAFRFDDKRSLNEVLLSDHWVRFAL